MIVLLQLAEDQYCMWATVDQVPTTPVMSGQEMRAHFDPLEYQFEERMGRASMNRTRVFLAAAGLTPAELMERMSNE